MIIKNEDVFVFFFYLMIIMNVDDLFFFLKKFFFLMLYKCMLILYAMEKLKKERYAMLRMSADAIFKCMIVK